MPETPDPRELAAEKRRARERRIRNLRARVVGVAVALFVAVWAGLYIQLVSGHDPALAGEPTPVTQTAPGDDEDSWSDGDTSSGVWSDEDTASPDAESSDPAAIATGQS